MKNKLIIPKLNIPRWFSKNINVVRDMMQLLMSPTRINSSLCLSFCPSVRAKRGIWSKRVLIRKIGNFFSACIEGILRLFTIFYLHRKFSIFWRNDRDCEAVEAPGIFDRFWFELQLVDQCGTREWYRIERYRVKECWVLWKTHIGYRIIMK